MGWQLKLRAWNGLDMHLLITSPQQYSSIYEPIHHVMLHPSSGSCLLVECWSMLQEKIEIDDNEYNLFCTTEGDRYALRMEAAVWSSKMTYSCCL